MELRVAVATFAALLYLASFASPVSAACTYVEYTSDKCRSAGHIWLSSPAWRSVTKGGWARINLRYSVSQIYWYCGSSRERTAWGKLANRLDVTFQSDGTIRWWVYKCTRCTKVDSTNDRCRSSHFIQVQGQRIYKNSYNRVIKLPGLQSQVYWYCGSSRERTAWGGLANELSIKYFSDGKIEWTINRCG